MAAIASNNTGILGRAALLASQMIMEATDQDERELVKTVRRRLHALQE